jgi:hypothetical protein
MVNPYYSLDKSCYLGKQPIRWRNTVAGVLEVNEILMKGFVITALFALLAWSNLDLFPLEYQFWRRAETNIMVQNNSDQDIQGVVAVVWSLPHPLGMIPKGKSRDFKARRAGDETEVLVRFRYGSEAIERRVGTLTPLTGYRMVVTLNYAGIVTAQVGPPGQEVLQQQ